MGLPIWRDPEEDQRITPAAVKRDPTASLRSSIRRRPSVHGRRHVTHAVPRLTRSPPPQAHSAGGVPPSPLWTANRHRSSRRVTHRGVPPITTLIESTDRRPELRRPTYPPPSLVERRDSDSIRANIQDLRQLSSSLGARAAHLRANVQNAMSVVSGRREELRSNHTRRRSRSPDDLRQQRRRSEGTRREPRGSVDRRPDATLPAVVPSPSSMSSDEVLDWANNDVAGRLRLRYRRHDQPPINGLGDRNRSPTPTDGWEIIRTTITADDTLPSTDDSFATAAAANSILRGNTIGITEPDLHYTLDGVQESLGDDAQNDSASPIDGEYLVCDEYDMVTTASVAEDMYFLEMSDLDGRERIACHQRLVAAEGRAYALGHEPDRVEIGFRLLNSALDSAEGRIRVRVLARTRLGIPPEEDEEADDDDANDANDANDDDGDRRDARPAADISTPSLPPPHAEPTASEDEEERDLVRRIVERLAARAEVPEEWWMGLGLDLPRPQDRLRARDERMSTAGRSPRRESERSRPQEGPRL